MNCFYVPVTVVKAVQRAFRPHIVHRVVGITAAASARKAAPVRHIASWKLVCVATPFVFTSLAPTQLAPGDLPPPPAVTQTPTWMPPLFYGNGPMVPGSYANAVLPGAPIVPRKDCKPPNDQRPECRPSKPVPEPETYVLFGGALMMLSLILWRRRP